MMAGKRWRYSAPGDDRLPHGAQRSLAEALPDHGDKDMAATYLTSAPHDAPGRPFPGGQPSGPGDMDGPYR